MRPSGESPSSSQASRRAYIERIGNDKSARGLTLGLRPRATVSDVEISASVLHFADPDAPLLSTEVTLRFMHRAPSLSASLAHLFHQQALCASLVVVARG